MRRANPSTAAGTNDDPRGTIAVVGAGIFGVTAAVKLAQRGYRIELFEERPDILMGASGINQFRLHRGYHYPRSGETAQECQRAEASFVQEYADAVLDDAAHYYAVAKQGSLVSASEFLAFCQRQQLAYEVAWPRLFRRKALELCVKVNERLIDPDALRAICWRKLAHPQISVHLNTHATASMLKAYDVVVVATYSMNNTLLSHDPSKQVDYQFELCEKPVVRLPKAFQGHSLVVMDGPFMCVDPFGRTGLFVMGNVVHAIHQTNVGKVPVIDARYRPLLNAGIITRPPLTRIKQFLAAASAFLPQLEQAEHVGSMFTVRTVLPDKDATDERPTIVTKINDRLITIFSGKLGTCVEAANDTVRIVEASAEAVVAEPHHMMRATP